MMRDGLRAGHCRSIHPQLTMIVLPTKQEQTMTKELIREAFWQSTQAFIEASKNNILYTDWHPVFGIL
jgi:hypothetical protein